MEKLGQKIQYLKGVGPQRSKYLNKLGIDNIFDLLWHIPKTYADRTSFVAVSSLTEGGKADIWGTVVKTEIKKLPGRKSIFKVWLKDDSGMAEAVWFNQAYLRDKIKVGQEIYISGRVKNNYPLAQINVSEFEILDGEDDAPGIVPVYGLTEGITQKIIRVLVKSALDGFLNAYPEIFTLEIRNRFNLISIHTALKNIHFPENYTEVRDARKRLAIEELTLFIGMIRQEFDDTEEHAGFVAHRERNGQVKEVMENLPFQLTAAQKKAWREIYSDMEAHHQMNRLLQGDVGSGKTVIAALAMAKAVASGFQASLMAPTEILAEQHFRSLGKLFGNTDIRMAVLTGSTPLAARRLIDEAVATGEIDILVGTHALLQEKVVFRDLGLVIIDEQHRFGVKQREKMGVKGKAPDLLVMSATPIPRTMALTVYGNLQITSINELPPGRKPVLTRYIPTKQKPNLYKYLLKELQKGGQAYIVCPLVEESEKQALQDAVTLYTNLQDSSFAEVGLGLIHGRLKAAEKEAIMHKFAQGEIKLLVSTSVIEVGVDVAAASIIVIEHAERFGLAQLHQLRGRVGRSGRQSYCFLTGNPVSEEAQKRIKAMEQISDGFKLAELDLILRGPGELWGIKQHGLERMKVADLARDYELIKISRAISGALDWSGCESLAAYRDLKFKRDVDGALN